MNKQGLFQRCIECCGRVVNTPASYSVGPGFKSRPGKGKKKVKQSRYTPWRRLEERKYISYSFTTSALDGGERSASRPGRTFKPGERTPGTHWTGGWVGPRAGLDTEARGKILCPLRESNSDRPVVQPVVRLYTA
jgi:hypothetical protein